MYYHKMGVHFGLSVFYCEKGGHFQTREQGWIPQFPVSEIVGTLYGTIAQLGIGMLPLLFPR